ncbi:MAG TPA: VapC toxin family PIN domain ribonuclease [Flavobacterium sp.]|jgi:predicted nucleic acid-binding protein|nr:VapC toxin family PIN domain ribonuclease [Flavobacterium sp.]
MNSTNFKLADTNFLINVSQDNPIVYPFLDIDICISFITEIELLGVFSINKTQKSNVQKMLNSCFVMEMNPEIKQITINLKQKYKLKLADAIIAATAIHYNLMFITSDADFKSIKELELIYLEK